MERPDDLIHERAAAQHNLITWDQALACGLSDAAVRHRVDTGRWLVILRGVYLIGLGPPSWVQRAHAACLGTGQGAVLSHRAAAALMDFDGFSKGPIEVTVPYGLRSSLPGVIGHRSRLLVPAEATLYRGIPVTRVERTLVEIGRYVPLVVVEKSFEYAVRRNLTTATSVERYFADMGSRLRGANRMRALLARRTAGPAAGSAAEVELIACLHEFGIEPPERQWRIDLGNGWIATVDLAWPRRRFAVEWDGADFHPVSARAYELERQNAILEIGWGLRRFTGGMLRRSPPGVAATIYRALLQADAA